MLPIEYLLLIAAILLLLSILASKASSKLGIPALLLFLIIGMLAGSDGLGQIYFNDPQLAQYLGVIALVLILFSGGLDTDWNNIQPVIRPGIILATLGVLITAVAVGLFAMVVLGLSFVEGLLLGAIVSSTDAAAVFGILRTRSIELQNNLSPLIELESGSNDPMAVFLTIGLTMLFLNPDLPFYSLVVSFFLQMIIGALLGYLFGRVLVIVLNRARLEYDGLYSVLMLTFVLLTYAVTSLLEGNGFLAVYLAGVVAGNADFVHKKSLMRFHDALGWLMQIAMFLALGLLVYPSQLIPIIDVGLLIAAFLIFVARPAAVFITLIFERFNFREKLLISWVGLRGAVPIILATFPLLASLPNAELYFNIVFFVVLTSVLFQGSLITPVANKLGIGAPTVKHPPPPLEMMLSGQDVSSELFELPVRPGSKVIGRQLINIGLPAESLIVLILRSDKYMVPSGRTVLEEGDRLFILSDKNVLPEVIDIIGG